MSGSADWVSVKDGDEEIAEAWHMPENGGVTLVLLVPRDRLAAGVTLATLLRAAAVSSDQVESWRLGDDSPAAGLDEPLPPPADDDSHQTVYVRLTPAGDVSLEKWQALDALWSAIVNLESAIDAARLGMDGLRAEMDNAFKRPLAVEEKLNGLQADIAQWTKAKSRVHHATPKIREFVHRATWAQAAAERKRLEEIVKNHVEPRIPLPDVDKLREELEHLQKDRQVLLATGNAVHQECRGILGEIQRATAALQRNAADRARQKRGAGRDKR